ncbi:MAG: 4'-phosphopantetheinyl transferase superfamily protein [Saprospiraceae bacterium]|nr:4'-phosphopantetheinyl transferase superfamily protein [Saprospiraceae bacterium]
MPFVDYIALEGQSIIGIWKNEESYEDLLLQLQPREVLLEQLNNLRLLKRKKEYMITRLLVRELLGEDKMIVKNPAGKPDFEDSTLKLSISHADKYSGVFISESKECGLDIEQIMPRISRLSKKFVSEYESLYVTIGKPVLHYTIMWCVKEAIYKWYAKRGLDFKQNMIIHPFKAEEEGQLYFELVKSGEKKTNIAYFKVIDNHVVAWLAM